MQEDKIARRYARALIDTIEDTETMLKVEGDLTKLSSLFNGGNKDFIELMKNPIFLDEERQKVMHSLSSKLGFDKLTVRFIDLLIAKKRLNCLPFIDTAYAALLDDKLPRSRASIISARKLLDIELASIVMALQNRIGKNIVAETEVDPAVLGGVKAKIGGFVFDRTLATQLAVLEQTLTT